MGLSTITCFPYCAAGLSAGRGMRWSREIQAVDVVRCNNLSKLSFLIATRMPGKFFASLYATGVTAHEPDLARLA